MTREQNEALAVLLPQAARNIRAAVSGSGGDFLRFARELDPLLHTEAEIQTAAVALLRRRELASPHAGPIAQAIVDAARMKRDKAKNRRSASAPPPAWAVDVAANSSPLRGGVIAVWWTAAGNNLSRAQAGISKGMGLTPGIPDMEVLLEGGSFHIEMKSVKGRIDPIQEAVAHAFENGAGRRVYVARCVADVAQILARELRGSIERCVNITS